MMPSTYLQQVLGTISNWSNTWQMELNIEKCVTLRCARSRCPLKSVYKLKDIVINDVHQYRYLGVLLDETTSWSPYCVQKQRNHLILSAII